MPPTFYATPDISYPRTIDCRDARVSICVRLRTASRGEPATVAELAVHEGADVALRIVAPGFEILGDELQHTHNEGRKDFVPVVFDLRPTRGAGTAMISIDFFYLGNHMGTSSFQVQVLGDVEE